MSANDGGPAFPRPEETEYVEGCAGMSLRDWFAGQALLSGAQEWGVSVDMRAEWCYAMADALLAEYVEGCAGMSLRDWFAGQALAGSSYDTPELAAQWVYEVADAMLAARKRKP